MKIFPSNKISEDLVIKFFYVAKYIKVIFYNWSITEADFIFLILLYFPE